jgi:hypothetical protein
MSSQLLHGRPPQRSLAAAHRPRPRLQANGRGVIQRCAENGKSGCACGVDQAVRAPGMTQGLAVRSGMGRLFATDFSQVPVSRPSDAAELEADQVADSVGRSLAAGSAAGRSH